MQWSDKFSVWFASEKHTTTSAGELFGCSAGMIHFMLRGARRPSLRLACRIEEATGGVLRASDMIDLPDGWELLRRAA